MNLLRLEMAAKNRPHQAAAGECRDARQGHIRAMVAPIKSRAILALPVRLT